MLEEVWKLNASNPLDKRYTSLNFCHYNTSNGGHHQQCDRVKLCPVKGTTTVNHDLEDWCLSSSILSYDEYLQEQGRGYTAFLGMNFSSNQAAVGRNNMTGQGAGYSIRCIVRNVKRFNGD